MKNSITSAAAVDGGTRRARRRPASGKFVLRLDPRLHSLLRDEASAAGVSLNDWCSRALCVPGAAGIDAAANVVQAIRSRGGNDLLGIIVYGSFARGELTTGSDVDLLVVLRAAVPITRSLYREWEGVIPDWSGREVDLHFVHLPTPTEHVSGSWAEVAVSGIVLYDRDLVVSRRLIAIRHYIAAGGLVRRFSQGQPYWIHGKPDAQP